MPEEYESLLVLMFGKEILEILARRDYIAMPEYEYREEHDGDGNPICFVTCSVEGFDFSTSCCLIPHISHRNALRPTYKNVCREHMIQASGHKAEQLW